MIDVKCNREEIVSAIMYSQSKHFKSVLKNAVNPYYKKDCLKLAQDSILNFIFSNLPKFKYFFDIEEPYTMRINIDKFLFQPFFMASSFYPAY